jgi:AcrR family transcriptional regulator
VQRERILRAMVEVVVERGYTGASVGLVIARARVSRRTFDRMFSGLEDCFAEVIDLGLECSLELVSEAFAGEKTWQDGVGMALASLLLFFDSEPLLARVWVVESLAAGAWALERRERNVTVLRELVLAGWPAADASRPPPLAAEGVMASVLGVLHSRLVTGKHEPLIELLGPLMGVVAGPYLPAREVALEVARGEELAREIQAAKHRYGPPRTSGGLIPALLSNPNARRARRCVVFLAGHPGASNREVAAGIGVAHESQVSRLLSCLAQERLATKHSAGAGKRNAWRLTSRGEEISRALRGEETGQ